MTFWLEGGGTPCKVRVDLKQHAAPSVQGMKYDMGQLKYNVKPSTAIADCLYLK